MNDIVTREAFDAAKADAGSVRPHASLSAEMRFFAEAFVAQGGRADLAAIAAGVPEDKAALQGSRWLCRKHVAAYIVELTQTFLHSVLPVAIRALIQCVEDDKAQWKDRIKAAEKLCEFCGLKPASPGVQVNVGVQVNGEQAQSIIKSVHEARSARLSDIPPAMPDTLQSDLNDIERLALPSPADPPGGDQLQGPAAATCPVPVSETAPPQKPAISCECEKCRGMEAPGENPFDAFRQAFDDE